MKLTRMMLMIVMAAGLAVSSWAAQEMSAQEKEMMQMMEKYSTPGPQHEFLKKYVGEWNVEVKSWMTPGGETMISKGAFKSQLIFDGRYVKGSFEGMMMDRKYMGLEIIGFDLFQKKYTTLWIDNMSTTFMLTSGTLDATGMVLTETGLMPDPMTGNNMTMRTTTTFMPDGSYKYAMFMPGPDGKEFKSMELTATKK